MNHPSVTPPQVVTPTPGALHANAEAPISARFHLLCCLGYTFLCLGWNAWAGRDQSWDQINYHLYVAHAWWHNRLPDELFAASAQGYLNPLPPPPVLCSVLNRLAQSACLDADGRPPQHQPVAAPFHRS